MHKKELKNLTDIAVNLVEDLCAATQPEAIKLHVSKAVENFHLQLQQLYLSSQHLPREGLEKVLRELVRIYRYDEGAGCFFIHQGTYCVVHPLKPEFNHRDLVSLADAEGKLFIQAFATIAKQAGKGFTGYRWLNPLLLGRWRSISSIFFIFQK
ncbi:MAG TPA: hypothetical protein ENN66_02165 [Proteobacteria bacterium]|nr:hypothetical protein [Pseudomonadota bacterium]